MIGSNRWSSQRTATMFSGTVAAGGLVQLGTEGADVVQQAAGLVLLGVEPGQAAQPLGVIAVLDDPRLETQALAGVVGGDQLHLADVEAELVQPFEAALDDPQLVESNSSVR